MYKSFNPRCTASFTAEYEYGSQLLFFVDIFALRGRSSVLGITNKCGASGAGAGTLRHLGRAVYDVQDVMGSMNNIKARRLRKGGVYVSRYHQLSIVLFSILRIHILIIFFSSTFCRGKSVRPYRADVFFQQCNTGKNFVFLCN